MRVDRYGGGRWAVDTHEVVVQVDVLDKLVGYVDRRVRFNGLVPLIPLNVLGL